MKGQMRRGEGGVSVGPRSVQVRLAKTHRPCAEATSACRRIGEWGDARDVCPRSAGRLCCWTVGGIVGADDARKRKGLWMRR